MEVIKRVEIPVPHPYTVQVPVYRHVLRTQGGHGGGSSGGHGGHGHHHYHH